MKKFLFVPGACAFACGIVLMGAHLAGSTIFGPPTLLPILLTLGGALGMILSGVLTRKQVHLLKADNFNGPTEWTHVGYNRHGQPINVRGFRR